MQPNGIIKVRDGDGTFKDISFEEYIKKHLIGPKISKLMGEAKESELNSERLISEYKTQKDTVTFDKDQIERIVRYFIDPSLQPEIIENVTNIFKDDITHAIVNKKGNIKIRGLEFNNISSYINNRIKAVVELENEINARIEHGKDRNAVIKDLQYEFSQIQTKNARFDQILLGLSSDIPLKNDYLLQPKTKRPLNIGGVLLNVGEFAFRMLGAFY
jgi:hypothetical protein